MAQPVPTPVEMDDTAASVEVESLTPAEAIALLQSYIIEEGVSSRTGTSPDAEILLRAEAKIRAGLARAGVAYDDSIGDED